MTEARKSVQKVRLVNIQRQDKNTQKDKITVNYIRLDGSESGKPGSASKLTGNYSEEEKIFLGSLKEGDEFVLTKVERTWTGDDGKQRQVWNLSTVAPISTWVDKVKKDKEYGFDRVGYQINNCISNAVISLGEGKPIAAYEERAREFVLMGNKLREEEESRRAGTKTMPLPAPFKETQTEPTQKAALADTFVDSFDDIPDFG